MLALALALASSAFSLRLPSQPPAAAAHVALRRALAPPRTAVAAAAATSTPFEFDELGDSWSASGGSSVGVLLLSVGSPETPDDVEEYLYNVFCDPEIVTLPPLLSWLKKPLAWFVAKSRAAEARAAMAEVGGESPQVATVRRQAEALQRTLVARGVDASLFIAMRYWRPYAEEAVAQMKAQNVTRLVILPLYPHFSISTSGSALRVLERMLYNTPGFPTKSTVVPSWFNRKGYVDASARAVQKALASLPEAERQTAQVVYSAQGLPRKYVEFLGDPYLGQAALLSEELRARGVSNPHTLSYQGQVGPSAVPWTEPSTADVITQLGADGTRALVLVPISFVFEHMGTLNEMDRELAAVAEQAGITSFARVETLGTDPDFIDALASVVQEALPDLNQPSMQIINQGEPVALNVVNEYVSLYTKDQLQLVPQERPWGFTEEAEVLNGRLAMTAITISVALTADPTLKAIVATYRAAQQALPS
ncbi:putative ferrochelatase [Emiliania huxleyi CCMP1516]|uniref:Ferrochelatase n=2 Tax=Emiliania huxleyi TaxID=2903 RepID=A0A0D3IFD7_EMIH1|nr:putative ferrochelatase [Emiliania huxleyi CCMP1516]XP_005784042.1 putative ferrochelatase [Emiliania huxleyi CCMP1516]EOD09972.1 putative ferrochelatase [Emiliania huxleyi CCMP1516]EOD31613.1 putative ferrochelatase [Emiliania huxleyi CCMP1516]|eukprot:XP_005762401.1 putative ferrochelatase [Emiliania huxleyi CCMP1516]